MRVWDLQPKYLCRQHLLGEHRELHGLWNILTVHKGTGGYSQHPETLRWRGRLHALFLRHEALVQEMLKRGYVHLSPLDKKWAKGKKVQDMFVDRPARQRKILAAKPCACFVS